MSHPTRPSFQDAKAALSAGTDTPTDADKAAAEQVAALGWSTAQQLSGLSRATIDRIRGGLPVRRGSLILARQVFAKVGQSEPRARRGKK